MVALLALLAPGLIRGLPPKTLVLTFHDVIERRNSSSLWFDCTTDELRGILTWLRGRGAHFITLDALYGHLTSGSALPSHPVAITFADNYEGFYKNGLPVLRQMHVPCAMFVHTGFVGSPVGRPKMTWGQLGELDREGLVTIGSQTVTHRSVATLDARTVSREFANSMRDLGRHLGHPVLYLAYPNGAFNDADAALAEKAGYRMAFTERLNPAESSPNIFEVARYVHTKYRQAWHDANR